MIHILTVHWKDDQWVDIQLAYLKKNIPAPYKVYAFLNHLSENHSDKFFYASTEDITAHATKLNLLADMVVLSQAPDDDWLIFIDGDAFPIADVVAFAAPKLKEYPLLAVQRLENLEDKQPHPLFCITTVGFWKQIKGDWNKGYKWQCKGRMATDVGGNLLGILEKNAIDWYRILRTNQTDLHHLNFAIYGDVVYHHGASFRPNISRSDKVVTPFKPGRLIEATRKFRLTRPIYQRYRKKHEIAIMKRNKKQSQEVFNLLVQDVDFYRMFMQQNGAEKLSGAAGGH